MEKKMYLNDICGDMNTSHKPYLLNNFKDQPSDFVMKYLPELYELDHLLNQLIELVHEWSGKEPGTGRDTEEGGTNSMNPQNIPADFMRLRTEIRDVFDRMQIKDWEGTVEELQCQKGSSFYSTQESMNTSFNRDGMILPGSGTISPSTGDSSRRFSYSRYLKEGGSTDNNNDEWIKVWESSDSEMRILSLDLGKLNKTIIIFFLLLYSCFLWCRLGRQQ